MISGDKADRELIRRKLQEYIDLMNTDGHQHEVVNIAIGKSAQDNVNVDKAELCRRYYRNGLSSRCIMKRNLNSCNRWFCNIIPLSLASKQCNSWRLCS